MDERPAVSRGTITGMYEDYRSTVYEKRKKEKVGDRLGTWLSGNKSDPMHDRFAAQVEEAVNDLAQSSPDTALAFDVLQYMYQVQREYADDSEIYFMMLAMHRYTIALIPFLSAADAEKLLALYEAAVPKRDRVPVVKDAMKRLKKQAKG